MFIQKIKLCQNNPEKSYTEKKAVYRPSGYSLVTSCSFDKSKNDQAMKIINNEKKKIIPLTDKEKETYEHQKICYICEQEFCTNENNKKEF